MVEKLKEVITRMHSKGEQLMADILHIGQMDDATYNILVERVGL